MALVKFVCPKCGQVYTINPNSKYQICPVCGEPLYKGDDLDIPDLSMPENCNGIQDQVRYGFKLLYFKSFDRLRELSKIMRRDYPTNYWSVMFSLIGETELDVVFLLPKIDYNLTEAEMREDAKARYYHYARRKYKDINQKNFNKIAGFYPDIPGRSRKNWIKAKTKYDEKVAMVNEYSAISSLIRSEYLEDLERYAVTDEQRTINYNLKIWMNQVSHAKADLIRYNSHIESIVMEDFEKTPRPGNKGLFSMFMGIYVLSVIIFIAAIAEIVLSIVRHKGFEPPFSYIQASIGAFVILTIMFLYIYSNNMFKKYFALTIIMIVGVVITCVAGIITANADVIVDWFIVICFIFSILIIFFTSFKLVKYFPHRTNVGTVLGDFQKLSNNSFEVDVAFVFQLYQGDDPEDLIYSEDWIRNN